MPLQSVDSARRERWFSPAKVLACFAICAIAAKLALLRSAGPCLEDRLHLQDQRLLSLRNSTQGQGTRITPPGATPPSGNRVLIITIATASHKEFVRNWVAHVTKLEGLEYLVATYDPELENFCHHNGINSQLFSIEALRQDLNNRQVSFTNGGLAKVAGWQFVHMHLRTGVDVLYSDIDTAWLRDPRPYFHEQPYADVMTSTDCLSHKYEGGGSLQLPVSNWGGELATQKFAGTWPRCGHTPGDYSGIGFNAGVILLRSRPATINFMERWEADMLKFEAPRDGHQAEGLHDMTDQESLIKVLTRGIHPIKEDPPGSRAFLAAGGSLRVAALQVLHFSNGHVYFVQRAPQTMGLLPYVVHATFQLAGNPGKMNRMREHHLWLVDPPAYYSGDFIGLDDMIPPGLLVNKGRGERSQLEAHLKLVTYYLHATHHLIGLARALGRTLILPRMICLCDRDEHPDVLPQCTTSASDLSLPYICPMDHVFDTARWEYIGMPFRPYSFLESPFLPSGVRNSILRLQLSFEGKAAPSPEGKEQRWYAGVAPGMDGGFQRSPGRTETSRIRVKTMNEDALAQIRKRAGNTRVVLLSGIGMDVPYCAGTADPEGETRLKDLQEQLVWQNSWCCSDFDKEKGTHPFQHPREYVKMQTC